MSILIGTNAFGNIFPYVAAIAAAKGAATVLIDVIDNVCILIVYIKRIILIFRKI